MSQSLTDVPDSPVGVASRPRPMSDSTLSQHTKSYIRPELLGSWPQKCAYVVEEVLTTERDYLSALEDIIEGYKNPLAGRLKMTNEGQQIIRTIFSNVEDLRSLHRWLLEQLTEREGDPHEFGRVFSDSETKFHVYSDYCTNYDVALETLTQLLKQSKDLESFILSCQRRLRHPLPLTSQLIKPVQRIMRYHLLLNELVRKFDPNVYGHASLHHAHKAMSRIADHVNEVKKRKENAERAQDIQNCLTGWSSNLSAYGRLILESPCRVGRRGAERQVILFEKLLLILKKKDVKRYNYKAHILTEELCIDKDSTSKPSPTFKVFSQARSSQTYVIITDNSKVQAQWVSEITTLLESLAELKRQEEAELEKLRAQGGTRFHRMRRRPQTIHEEPRYRYGSSQSKHTIGSRKRPRPDVRDMFPEEEEGGKVQLVSVKGLPTSPAHPTRTVSDPQPSDSSVKYVRISDQSDLGNGSKREMKSSKSSDSVVSLGDVELGMDDVISEGVGGEGVTGVEGSDETDSPPDSTRGDTPVRKPSLTRKAAIKVKKTSVNPNSSYQSIIRIRAKEARRSMKASPDVDEAMEQGQHSDEEESELSRIIGSPQTSLHQTHSPVHETSQSIEYDSLYQSGGLEARGPPPLPSTAANGGYEIEIDDLSPTDKMPEYSESGRVYDSGLGELEGSTALGVGEFPSYEDRQMREGGDPGEGVSGVEGVEDEGIMILEDSSDSEDDEDSSEEPLSPLESGSLVSMETFPEGVIPPPSQFVSENGLSQGPAEEPTPQSLSSEEPANFSSESPSSHDQSHDLSGDLPEEHTKGPVDEEAPSSYQFNGKELDTIFATLPRKSRYKSGSYMSKSQATTPSVPHPTNSHLSQSSHTLSRSAARRADGFSRLLEFTRQQSSSREMSPARKVSAPVSHEVTQSLPVGGLMRSRSSSRSLGDIHEGRDEDGEPCEAGEVGDAFEPSILGEDREAGEGGEPCEGSEDDAPYLVMDNHPPDTQPTEVDTEELQVKVTRQSHDTEAITTGQSHDLTIISPAETVTTDPSATVEPALNYETENLESKNVSILEPPSLTSPQSVPTQDALISTQVSGVGDDQTSAPPSEGDAVTMGNLIALDQPSSSQPQETLAVSDSQPEAFTVDKTHPEEVCLEDETQPLETVMEDKSQPEEMIVEDDSQPEETIIENDSQPKETIVQDVSQPEVTFMEDKNRPQEIVLKENSQPEESTVEDKNVLLTQNDHLLPPTAIHPEAISDTQSDETGSHTGDQDASNQELSSLPEAVPTESMSELRKRTKVTPSPLETRVPSMETVPETLPLQEPVSTVTAMASPQPRSQDSTVVWRVSRMIGGWLPRCGVGNGLLLLGVLAVSSVLVYAGVSYAGLW